jgi:hypothetical protein
LALWINQGTQWFFGEPPETTRTRCSLRQSPLMTRLPRSPGSTLVLRLNQETVHDFILLFMPSCGPHLTPLATVSLERSLLVFSTPEGLTGDDLSCLFSPAPTLVKPQPAPALLSQESVHTTLSITHHTRKRPSTGPRTTHGPQWLNQETVHDFILLFLPPCGTHLTLLATGTLNEAYLSSPHLEASPATTFRICFPLAPTRVKPQPAPAILSQELVHTTLSITHHTKMRPSTGPQTTHGPQSPP